MVTCSTLRAASGCWSDPGTSLEFLCAWSGFCALIKFLGSLCADQISWRLLRWSKFLAGCAPQQLPSLPGGICCWTANGSKSGRSYDCHRNELTGRGSTGLGPRFVSPLQGQFGQHEEAFIHTSLTIDCKVWRATFTNQSTQNCGDRGPHSLREAQLRF